MLRSLQDNNTITAEESEILAQIFADYFGTGGSIDMSLAEFIASLTNATNNAILQIRYIQAALSGNFAVPQTRVKPVSPLLDVDSDGYAGDYAQGGTLIAKKPTLALFGEAGPERVDFTPLSRPGADVGKVFGGYLPGGSSSNRLELMIRYDEGLIAEIIDTTLSQTADVVVNVERAL